MDVPSDVIVEEVGAQVGGAGAERIIEGVCVVVESTDGEWGRDEVLEDAVEREDLRAMSGGWDEVS